MTQREAGKLIGVGREGLCDWENHVTEPTIEFYPSIIQFLGYVPFEFDAETLAGKIKRYRYLNGLGQVAMGKLAGIGAATIFRIEHGVGIPSKKIMRALENFFGKTNL